MHSNEAPDGGTENIKEETCEDFFYVPLDSLNEESVVNIHDKSFDIYTNTLKEGIDAQENVFKKHDKQFEPNESLDSFVVKPEIEKANALEETAENNQDIHTNTSKEADVDIQETEF